jgi:hypothetical protein
MTSYLGSIRYPNALRVPPTKGNPEAFALAIIGVQSTARNPMAIASSAISHKFGSPA